MKIVQRLRLALAIGFFVAWVTILLLGADWPPPPGFVWIVVLDVIAAILVYLRIPVYINWCRNEKPYRSVRAAMEGLLVGTFFGAAVLIFHAQGEPGINTPPFSAHAIWIAVLGSVGAVNAWLVYFASVMINRLNTLRVGRQ